MKSLMLLRHAEALPTTPALADLERTLSVHGEQQARRLGMWMGARGWTPQAILCSSAQRARQTAEAVAATAGWASPMTVLESLYNANADDMITVLREQASNIDSLLLVAHAPGVAELASALTTRQSDLSLACEPATLIEVVAALDDWCELGRNCANLRLLLPA